MAHSGSHKGDPALVVALAAGLTNKQAAKEAGVSERTVIRRLSDPAFKRRVEEARAETLAQTSARLTAVGIAAVRTLLRLLDADSEQVRLAAAKSILDMGVRLREASDHEARIAELQDRLNQLEGLRGPRIIA